MPRSEKAPLEPPPFDCIALILQGGGALGAYQAGAYQALAEGGLHPDWLAGISIGAINAAIIAGNRPGQRVERLRDFWQTVSTDHGWADLVELTVPFARGNAARGLFSQWSSTHALLTGQPGFFEPRVPPAWMHAPGTPEATSYYDTSKLRATLEALVDFDYLNAGEIRLSVGAVNVRTGNFTYFDSEHRELRPEHIMASGALPPGFPAVEIDGERYWDGGLVSNTPLQWLLESQPFVDTLAFQIDLWSALGTFPNNLAEVAERQKDIQYSSRTRLNTDQFRNRQNMRRAVAALLDKLPPELADEPEVKYLREQANHHVFNIVHLIYRRKSYESHFKDYEFSRVAMNDHWQAGHNDVRRALRHADVLKRPQGLNCVVTHDINSGHYD